MDNDKTIHIPVKNLDTSEGSKLRSAGRLARHDPDEYERIMEARDEQIENEVSDMRSEVVKESFQGFKQDDQVENEVNDILMENQDV